MTLPNRSDKENEIYNRTFSLIITVYAGTGTKNVVVKKILACCSTFF